MAQHRTITVIKSHVVPRIPVDNKFRPRRVIMITAGSMVELTETLNDYMERNPITGTIYSTGFNYSENEYYALVRNTFDEPAAEKPFECPLNTDQLTLGQHDVYFKEYPDIKWCVDHIDGDYVYLGLYNVSKKARFNYINSVSYAGSTIAHRCDEFLSNIIPNVAQYLEDVTVYGVTNKVFIPNYKMFFGIATSDGSDASDPTFDWPSASAYNRKACVSNWGTIGNYFWLSSPVSSSIVWCVFNDGNFYGSYPSYSFGFRPEVKVRYRKGDEA